MARNGDTPGKERKLGTGPKVKTFQSSDSSVNPPLIELTPTQRQNARAIPEQVNMQPNEPKGGQ